MAETEHARFVCLTCSSRKKACDKVVPACGPCVKRGLSCKYDDSGKKEKGPRAYNPGKHFVASDTWSSPNNQGLAAHSSWTSSPDTVSSSISVPQSIRDSLNQQVQDVMNITNLTADDISSRYFQSFHRLYPIISPELFQRVASKHAQGSNIPPSTDYSILILAMFLAITLPGYHRHSVFSLTGQEQLYVRIKSLLAQVQTVISPSLAFVQIMFIVTIWEYTRARPEAAYSSINTCASLARILGVGNELLEQSAYSQGAINIDLVEMEKRNDRLGGTEQQEYTTPLTIPKSQLSTTSGFVAVRCISECVSGLPDLNVSHAIFFSGWEPTELEVRIRTFLVVLLEESRRENTTLCSAVAFSIRALFLLHWTILDSLPQSEDVDSSQIRNLSWIALNSACNMTIDGIVYAAQDPSAAVPICSLYILQDSIRYLSEQQKVIGDEATISDLNMLLHADREYRSTYVF
uniref:Aflatoxin biosynthesis regulatory protein n=1 Tax=Talaromyces marneffei PM1 TaxID=1077442 RepID=A0A093Y4F7_TALMA